MKTMRHLAFVLSFITLALAGSAGTVQAEQYTFSTLAGPLNGFAGSTDGTGSVARFSSPNGVAVDASGNVYVADTLNSTIRKMTAAGVVTTLAGNASNRGSTDGTGSAALFRYPQGVAADTKGNVYVADTTSHTIRKITSAGVVTTVAGRPLEPGSNDGTGTAALFNYPYGVAVDANDNVYVADRNNHTIRQINSVGVVSTLAGGAGSSGSMDGGGSAARFNSPSGIAVDTLGNVYVADTGNQLIRKITSAGAVTTLVGSAGISGSADGIGSAARFNAPSSVAVDASGKLYVADSGNSTIRKITTAGVVTTLGGSAGTSGGTNGTGSAARFGYARGVAADAAGNAYVADSQNNSIRYGIPAIQAWRQQYFSTRLNTGTSANTADPDKDGVPNLAEFAFGLNPTSGASVQLPSFQRTGGAFLSTFTQPAAVSGITYGAQWSTSLSSGWAAIPDTGIGNTHTFSVSVGTNSRIFCRYLISEP